MIHNAAKLSLEDFEILFPSYAPFARDTDVLGGAQYMMMEYRAELLDGGPIVDVIEAGRNTVRDEVVAQSIGKVGFVGRGARIIGAAYGLSERQLKVLETISDVKSGLEGNRATTENLENLANQIRQRRDFSNED